MRFRWVAQQAVHRSRLGGTQVDVVFGGVLKPDEECLGTAQGVRAEFVAVLEPELVGELADERAVLAAGTPDGHVGLAGQAVAEVEQADVLQDFLDDGVADQMDLFFRVSS